MPIIPTLIIIICVLCMYFYYLTYVTTSVNILHSMAIVCVSLAHAFIHLLCNGQEDQHFLLEMSSRARCLQYANNNTMYMTYSFVCIAVYINTIGCCVWRHHHQWAHGPALALMLVCLACIFLLCCTAIHCEYVLVITHSVA